MAQWPSMVFFFVFVCHIFPIQGKTEVYVDLANLTSWGGGGGGGLPCVWWKDITLTINWDLFEIQ